MSMFIIIINIKNNILWLVYIHYGHIIDIVLINVYLQCRCMCIYIYIIAYIMRYIYNKHNIYIFNYTYIDISYTIYII